MHCYNGLLLDKLTSYNATTSASDMFHEVSEGVYQLWQMADIASLSLKLPTVRPYSAHCILPLPLLIESPPCLEQKCHYFRMLKIFQSTEATFRKLTGTRTTTMVPQILCTCMGTTIPQRLSMGHIIMVPTIVSAVRHGLQLVLCNI